MADGLLDWLDSPRADAGIQLADEADGFEQHSYEELAARVAATSGWLRDAGVRSGDVVALVYTSGPSFVATFTAVLCVGATPTPVAPPTYFPDRQQYLRRTAAILAAAAPALVACDPALEAIVGEAAQLARLERPAHAWEPRADHSAELVRARPAELALLQFTSGSTGTPRGVRVGWSNLEANIDAIRRWLAMGRDDVTAMWIPIYHDMGLIGCVLTPLVNRSTILMLRPDQFIRDPNRWLDCFGRRGATLTASPRFGYAYSRRRLAADRLEDWDFSDWRVAIVGAERIDAGALGGLASALGARGFRSSAFRPAYGLAEATLAVTGTNGEEPVAARLRWDELEFGADAPAAEVRPLARTELERPADWLVGCGRPLAGCGYSIVDDDRQPLPDGRVGEIVAHGDSVAAGYHRHDTADGFEGGSFTTGDAGFTLDGQLFVIGRLGDSLKAGGRSVFAEDLEAKVAGVDGLKRGHVAALLGVHDSHPTALILTEDAAPESADRVRRLVRVEAGDDARIVMLNGPRGTIERTTSGKPRRRVMWRRLESDGLAGGGVSVVFDELPRVRTAPGVGVER